MLLFYLQFFILEAHAENVYIPTGDLKIDANSHGGKSELAQVINASNNDSLQSLARMQMASNQVEKKNGMLMRQESLNLLKHNEKEHLRKNSKLEHQIEQIDKKRLHEIQAEGLRESQIKASHRGNVARLRGEDEKLKLKEIELEEADNEVKKHEKDERLKTAKILKEISEDEKSKLFALAEEAEFEKAKLAAESNPDCLDDDEKDEVDRVAHDTMKNDQLNDMAQVATVICTNGHPQPPRFAKVAPHSVRNEMNNGHLPNDLMDGVKARHLEPNNMQLEKEAQSFDISPSEMESLEEELFDNRLNDAEEAVHEDYEEESDEEPELEMVEEDVDENEDDY